MIPAMGITHIIIKLFKSNRPKKDLASRISWASNHYKKPSEPLFNIRSLGVYGKSDIYILSDVRFIDKINMKLSVLEMSRLARELYYQNNNPLAQPILLKIENAIDDIGEELYLGSGCYWGGMIMYKLNYPHLRKNSQDNNWWIYVR